MSSLWTPDGEHPVERQERAQPAQPAPTQPAPAQPATTSSTSRSVAPPPDPDGVDEPSEEEAEAIRAQLDEARSRVAEVPPEVIIINHAMGLYELAAIHLSGSPPDLAASALAIDAFACLVEGLGDRLGPDAGTLRDALGQIRLAFVQIKGRLEGSPES